MTNYSADDIKDFLVNNQEFSDYYLAHYGLPRRSGRYNGDLGRNHIKVLDHRLKLVRSL